MAASIGVSGAIAGSACEPLLYPTASGKGGGHVRDEDSLGVRSSPSSPSSWRRSGPRRNGRPGGSRSRRSVAVADVAVNLPPGCRPFATAMPSNRSSARIFRCAAPGLRPSVIVRNTRFKFIEPRGATNSPVSLHHELRGSSRRSKQTTEAPEKGKEAARKEASHPMHLLVLTHGKAGSPYLTVPKQASTQKLRLHIPARR
jgi:hypothetical protein